MISRNQPISFFSGCCIGEDNFIILSNISTQRRTYPSRPTGLRTEDPRGSRGIPTGTSRTEDRSTVAWHVHLPLWGEFVPGALGCQQKGGRWLERLTGHLRCNPSQKRWLYTPPHDGEERNFFEERINGVFLIHICMVVCLDFSKIFPSFELTLGVLWRCSRKSQEAGDAWTFLKRRVQVLNGIRLDFENPSQQFFQGEFFNLQKQIKLGFLFTIFFWSVYHWILDHLENNFLLFFSSLKQHLRTPRLRTLGLEIWGDLSYTPGFVLIYTLTISKKRKDARVQDSSWWFPIFFIFTLGRWSNLTCAYLKKMGGSTTTVAFFFWGGRTNLCQLKENLANFPIPRTFWGPSCLPLRDVLVKCWRSSVVYVRGREVSCGSLVKWI